MAESGGPADAAEALVCPFCGASLTDRVDLEGKRFLVFRCMFTPEVDPAMSDGEIAERLRAEHAGGGSAYFRGVCDRLHAYVLRPGTAGHADAEP